MVVNDISYLNLNLKFEARFIYYASNFKSNKIFNWKKNNARNTKIGYKIICHPICQYQSLNDEPLN